jgi:hypothetical protein
VHPLISRAPALCLNCQTIATHGNKRGIIIMASIRILEGKSLASAIKGGASKVETFGQFFHELAYGALLHAEKHGDACHVNGVFALAPVKYQSAFKAYFKAFGKVSFADKKFSIAKGKESNLVEALATSPMNYEKEAKAGDKKPVSFLERVKKMAMAEMEKVDASPSDIQAARAAVNWVEAYSKPSLSVVAKVVQESKKPAPRVIKALDELSQAA